MGLVVVVDQLDFLFRRNSLIDYAQKLQPLLMAMFLLARSEELAISDIQRRKRGGLAVALVIVRHGLAAALLEGKTAVYDPAPESGSSHQ